MNNESLRLNLLLGESNLGNKLVEREMEKEEHFGAVNDWRKLFSAFVDQTLSFFPPKSSGSNVLVSLPADVYEEGELQWKNVVVAQFVGKISNFSVFQKMVNLL